MSKRAKIAVLISGAATVLLMLLVAQRSDASSGGISPTTVAQDVPIHVNGNSLRCRIGTYAKRAPDRTDYHARIRIVIKKINGNGYLEQVDETSMDVHVVAGTKPHLGLKLSGHDLFEMSQFTYVATVHQEFQPFDGTPTTEYRRRAELDYADCEATPI